MDLAIFNEVRTIQLQACLLLDKIKKRAMQNINHGRLNASDTVERIKTYILSVRQTWSD